jgi:hypothetical protein
VLVRRPKHVHTGTNHGAGVRHATMEHDLIPVHTASIPRATNGVVECMSRSAVRGRLKNGLVSEDRVQQSTTGGISLERHGDPDGLPRPEPENVAQTVGCARRRTSLHHAMTFGSSTSIDQYAASQRRPGSNHSARPWVRSHAWATSTSRAVAVGVTWGSVR